MFKVLPPASMAFIYSIGELVRVWVWEWVRAVAGRGIIGVQGTIAFSAASNEHCPRLTSRTRPGNCTNVSKQNASVLI